MRHHRAPASNVDIPAVIEAGLALRVLGKRSPVIAEHFPNFIVEELGAAYGGSLAIFIAEAAAYAERAQRFAGRFRSWRHSKLRDPGPIGKPDRIGAPQRPVRRIRGEEINVEGVLSTVRAVRALDRERRKARAPRFVKDIAEAFDGWPAGFIYALIVFAERDRRVARRFRSWRRAKASRAAAAPQRGKSVPKRCY